MPEITKEDLDKSNKILADLQAEIKKSNSDKDTYDEKFKSLEAETKLKIKKIEADLKAKDAEFQKALLKEDKAANEIKTKEQAIEDFNDMLKSTEHVKKQDELMTRIKELELDLIKTSKGVTDKKMYLTGDHYKALELYVKEGDSAFTPEQIKTLRTDVGSQGGYLVPVELYTQILEEVEELDPIRPLARVFSSKVKTLEVPIRTSLPTATFEGELETVPNSQSGYRLEQMTAYRQHINTPITWDQINFANYDMIQQMSKDAAMAFAIGEGQGFLSGNGVKNPEGILTNADVLASNVIETATSETLSLTDVVALPGNLKNGYLPQARFFMNQKTLYDLRAEQDENGNFLWRIGGEGMPNNIAGIPFVILPSMPNVAASAYALGIGNFFYGYYILDAVGLMMIRDDYTRKTSAVVEMTWIRYLTGQVGIAEAFKLLQVQE